MKIRKNTGKEIIMGNYSQALSFGQKLFRSFGKGVDTRHVITETIDGKTYTRVLKAEGKVLENRIKTIERFAVGNKKVVRSTKEFMNGTRHTDDRVLDSNGNYLGHREVVDYGNQKNIFKFTADNSGTQKEISDGITHKKSVYDKDEEYIDSFSKYNNKGLPIPRGVGLFDSRDKSLQEMLRMAGDDARYYGYFDSWTKLEHITPRFNLENYVKNMSWEV